jgi:hypothetical protein
MTVLDLNPRAIPRDSTGTGLYPCPIDATASARFSSPCLGFFGANCRFVLLLVVVFVVVF